jgi:NADP-dependent 3-hydroxy acid dehydrogenase YdfG
VHQVQETARAIEAFGAKAIVVETDVTSQDSVGALFASIDKEGLVVDVAALNAGATEPWAPLHESEPAAWLNTWDVQVRVDGSRLYA